MAWGPGGGECLGEACRGSLCSPHSKRVAHAWWVLDAPLQPPSTAPVLVTQLTCAPAYEGQNVAVLGLWEAVGLCGAV